MQGSRAARIDRAAWSSSAGKRVGSMEDDSGDEASPQVARGGGGGGAVPGGGGGGDGGGAAVSGGSGGDGQQQTGDYRGWMLKSGPAGGDSDKTGVKRQLSVLSVSMRRAFFTMGDFKRRWCVRARAVDACCCRWLAARRPSSRARTRACCWAWLDPCGRCCCATLALMFSCRCRCRKHASTQYTRRTTDNACVCVMMAAQVRAGRRGPALLQGRDDDGAPGHD